MHHLVGTHEVALRIGVTRQRVLQLAIAYPDFPKPAAVLQSGNVWRTEDIDAWLRSRPDRPSGRHIGAPNAGEGEQS